MNFLELLSIYKWAILASATMSATLAMIGAHWTARGKATQIFVLGQGSSLGVVLGLALNVLFDMDVHGLNLAMGFALGGATLFLSDHFLSKRADRSFAYLTMFIGFLSLTYIITSLIPALESHMAASYFGDIAVMSNTAAYFVFLLGVMGFIGLTKHWRSLTRASFEVANQSLIHRTWQGWFFDLSTIALTTVAVQNLGYLFTTGSLFVATTFASSHSKGVANYRNRLCLIAVTGSVIGFLGSLLSSEIPTAPAMIMAQMIVGLIVYVKK